MIISLIKKMSVVVVLITNDYVSTFLVVFLILARPELGLSWA